MPPTNSGNQPVIRDFRGTQQPAASADTLDASDALDQVMPAVSENVRTMDETLPTPKRRLPWRRTIGLSLIGIGVVTGILLTMHAIATNKQRAALQANLASADTRISTQSVGLNSLSQQLNTTNASQISTLTVNGRINVSNSLILQPTSQPGNAVAGQIYYDQTSKNLQYYNGSAFVSVGSGGSSSSVTNVFNSSAGGGGISASGGTPGALAMFSNGSTLTSSLITQSGTTVSVGGNNLNVGTSTSAINIQSGLGGIMLASAAGSGSTGNITIQSGNSSATTSGNVTVDTGSSFVSGTVIEDFAFEDGIDNMQPWTGPGVTAVQNCTVAHTGSCSLDFTGSTFAGILQNENVTGAAVVPGHHYFFSLWVKAASTPASITSEILWNGSTLVLTNATDNPTGWTQITGSGVAPAGTGTAYLAVLFNTVSVESHYIDDFTVTDLSSSSSISEINIGAANAQFVNIGNLNEVGATTINGGSGININSGSGTLSVSGGAINVAGSAASNLTTSSGALTITSAGAATWSIGQSTSGAGGNLTIHAGAGQGGGNNNGGNLILQGGLPTGTGTGGGVDVKPLADSTTAFQIQNAAASTNLMTVDSVNDTVSLGVGAGTDFGNASIGFFSNGDQGIDEMTASKFTTSSGGGGQIVSISGYIGRAGVATTPNNEFQFAIYADNGGNPGAYIASSSIGTLTTAGAWYTLPISTTLSANTIYWLVYWQHNNVANTNNGMAYSGGAAGAVIEDSTFTWQSGPNNGMPATFPTSGATISGGFLMSIYASYASTGPALTLSSGGLLTQSGPALFQDPTSSTQAFQIQNATGQALFTADTASLTITIAGVSGSFATLALSNAHVGSTQSAIPTIGTPTNCGTSPIAAMGTGATDTAGTFTITTGTGGTSSTCDTVLTFNQPYANAPKTIIVEGTSNVGSVARQIYVSGSSTTTFTTSFATSAAGANSTPYTFTYWVVQ